MANTVTITGPVITISNIDSDYDLNDILPIQSIRLNAGTGTTSCIIKNGSDAGAPLFKVSRPAGEEFIQYFHAVLARPYLDFSAGVYPPETEVTIILQRGRS